RFWLLVGFQRGPWASAWLWPHRIRISSQPPPLVDLDLGSPQMHFLFQSVFACRHPARQPPQQMRAAQWRKLGETALVNSWKTLLFVDADPYRYIKVIFRF